MIFFWIINSNDSKHLFYYHIPNMLLATSKWCYHLYHQYCTICARQHEVQLRVFHLLTCRIYYILITNETNSNSSNCFWRRNFWKCTAKIILLGMMVMHRVPLGIASCMWPKYLRLNLDTCLSICLHLWDHWRMCFIFTSFPRYLIILSSFLLVLLSSIYSTL